MRKILLFGVLSWAVAVKASTIFGGSINYQQLSPLNYRLNVVLFTKNFSNYSADSVEVNLGDGSSKYLLRVNGVDSNLNGIPDGELFFDGAFRKNVYSIDYTYSQAAVYVVSYLDLNRMDGIGNVDFGNSVNVPFYIEDSVNTGIFNSQPSSQGVCHVYAAKNQTYTCNRLFIDADGDSLTFELITPLQDAGINVPIYVLPNQLWQDTNDAFTIDNSTGELTWNAPRQVGIYLYAFKIREFRNGTEISNSMEDHLIFVIDSTVLSITDNYSAENADFLISPNPAINTVTINIDETLIGATATITDITGRTIAAVELTTANGQLTTENFASGVYFVTITNKEGRSATKKLVIQK